MENSNEGSKIVTFHATYIRPSTGPLAAIVARRHAELVAAGKLKPTLDAPTDKTIKVRSDDDERLAREVKRMRAAPPVEISGEINVKTHGTKIGTIKRTVADAYGLTVADIDGQCRKRHVTEARMVAVFLAMGLLPSNIYSTKVVGKHFGNRDHTTIINAVTVIKRGMRSDGRLRSNVDALYARLAEHFDNEEQK